jgi:hypothetical protein
MKIANTPELYQDEGATEIDLRFTLTDVEVEVEVSDKIWLECLRHVFTKQTTHMSIYRRRESGGDLVVEYYPSEYYEDLGDDLPRLPLVEVLRDYVSDCDGAPEEARSFAALLSGIAAEAVAQADREDAE